MKKSQNKFGRHQRKNSVNVENRELRKIFWTHTTMETETPTSKTTSRKSTSKVSQPEFKKVELAKAEKPKSVATVKTQEVKLAKENKVAKKAAAKKEVVKTKKFEFVNWKEQQFDAQEVETPLVTLRGVNVVFGRGANAVHAMKNINLNIYKNEVLGLVGESGSGKTTTGRAICGIQEIVSGQIKIGELALPQDVSKIKGEIRKAIIDKVQMIFQDPANSLNPQKTIYSVASEGLHNIDVKSNFLTGFVNDTLISARKLSLELSETFDNYFNVKAINELVKAKKWKEVIEELFVLPVEKLTKAKKTYSSKVCTYLNVKKAEAVEMAEAGKIELEAIKKKIIVNLLAAVGLDDQVLNRFPLEFSGGQQQRIGIVRAVAMRPQIIVADEPISALDVSIQAQVINILNDLKEQFNLTILFIAHDLRMVEYISDRIAIMYRGEIVEIGETDHVVKNPLHPYTKMLLKAVPSIDKIHENLAGEYYNPAKYKVEGEEKEWFQVKDENHFVFASKGELENFFKKESGE